jgi:PPOX class probable F420-dependent enzyme
MPELPPDVVELVEGPSYGHLATLMRDGSPHSVPVWLGHEAGHVCFFTQEASQKAKNVARDPRVAISIADHANPYRMVSLRGRVVGTYTGDRALEVMDRMARVYTGEDFPVRRGVLYLVEVERVARMTLPFEHRPG